MAEALAVGVGAAVEAAGGGCVGGGVAPVPLGVVSGRSSPGGWLAGGGVEPQAIARRTRAKVGWGAWSNVAFMGTGGIRSVVLSTGATTD